MLSKETDNKWKIKYHKEIKESDGKKISSSDFDSAFPKPNSSITALKDAWKFLDGGTKLNDICSADECKDSPKTESPNIKLLWKWQDKGSDKVGAWSSDMK